MQFASLLTHLLGLCSHFCIRANSKFLELYAFCKYAYQHLPIKERFGSATILTGMNFDFENLRDNFILLLHENVHRGPKMSPWASKSHEKFTINFSLTFLFFLKKKLGLESDRGKLYFRANLV